MSHYPIAFSPTVWSANHHAATVRGKEEKGSESVFSPSIPFTGIKLNWCLKTLQVQAKKDVFCGKESNLCIYTYMVQNTHTAHLISGCMCLCKFGSHEQASVRICICMYDLSSWQNWQSAIKCVFWGHCLAGIANCVCVWFVQLMV